MRKLTPLALIIAATLLTACETAGSRPIHQDVPTEVFIDNTLRQYGIGPNGRIGSPDAVIVDPTAPVPANPESDEPLLS